MENATAAPAATERSWLHAAPFYLTAAAAVTTEISIAGFQILMGLALVALLATRGKLRWPPVATPLAVWMIWSLISFAVSGHFRDGFPQIKKFYVYLLLFLVVSAVRTLQEVRAIVLGWAAAAALSAAWGLEQFVRKYEAARAAHQDFYIAYIANRITGLMGHWMTFSGHMMMALLLILALILFSREQSGKAWLIAAGLLISAALLLAETRSMWGGAAAGAVYLLWCKKPWSIAALPVTVALLLLVNPFGLRERALSIVHPHGTVDSNVHRALLRRVGWGMIKDHPFVGLGPEEVGPNVTRYIPSDFHERLPDGYYGHLHNIYFHYAAERGLPALAALLWFFGQALYDFARALRRSAANSLARSEARWILHGAIAVTIAFMLAGYFEVNFGDSEVLGMFLAVVGSGYVAMSFAGD